jgi:hypothetical protein
LCYGTGSAPNNGDAATGTTIGINTLAQNSAVTLPYGVPFTKSYLITSLTPGTAYWFDVQLLTNNNATTASILNVAFTAQELIS